MKLINIPPYRGANYTPTEGHYFVRELIGRMRKKGQLEGVEVDVDEGYPAEHTGESRDAEYGVSMAVGFLKRVRMHCEGDKYDAIVSSGGVDPAFFAARMISKIPIAFALHSAVHAASLIGDRFTVMEAADPLSLIVRGLVQSYGLGHKMVSVRHVSHSSTKMMGVIRKYPKEDRLKSPEGKKLIEDILAPCIAAIEEDRVDSIILGTPTIQCFEDEIKQRLNEAGYGEIVLICELSAAVEMAKAMVNMKLMQTPRAYPSDGLKAKPKFR